MKEFVSTVSRGRAYVELGRRTLLPLSPLLVRLTLGVVFIGSGWGKLSDLDRVTEFFTELGIVAPRLNAGVVATVELGGGALVAVGLGTRLAALPLAFTMVVALSTALAPDISGVAELVGLSEFTYLVMFLTLALGGPGRWSLDHLLFSKPNLRPRAVPPRIDVASDVNLSAGH